ncbi:AfsR/SARP family transcriptional regulator [Streptomyces xantholiticus]|uniref:AfsR/SARP family transcriptional regulator n=1 Tax=Streptomyces xantholiticus TaxID=68285 RepID=A0ABV1V4Q4_9ACTN
MHRGRTVSVDRLIDALWGDAPPASDVRTLRSKVSQLRRTLEDAEPGSRHLIESRPQGYLLRVDDDAVDAGRFEALLRRAQAVTGDPRTKSRLLGEAAKLWRGATAFADDADKEFVRVEARRLEEQHLVAHEELAEARLELGEHAVLAGELGELVAAHPLRERLRSMHVRALYLAGRQSEALASLGELRDRLRKRSRRRAGRAAPGDSAARHSPRPGHRARAPRTQQPARAADGPDRPHRGGAGHRRAAGVRSVGDADRPRRGRQDTACAGSGGTPR